MNLKKMTVQIKIDGKATEITHNQAVKAKIMGQRMDVEVTNNTDFSGVVVITYNKIFDLVAIQPNGTIVFNDLHTLEEKYTVAIEFNNVKRVLNDSGTKDADTQELSFRIVN